MGSTMKKKRKESCGSRDCGGSALILAVVLTSLLGIVGVLFLMSGRIEQVATSAVAENKDLGLAVDSVVARISQELVADVNSGVGNPQEEYYDYPDPCNAWLTSLEPRVMTTMWRFYYWRQISNIYNVAAASTGLWGIGIVADSEQAIEGEPADADGDGVADSVWVRIPDVTSSKGRPIYAAVRVVDNGGMLNVNTGYMFDACDPDVTRVDGSSVTQINLAALSQRGSNGTLYDAANELQRWRCNDKPALMDLFLYERDVIWRYGNGLGAYTPFDISDELKLRNRYILNYNLMTSRIEGLWTRAYEGGAGVLQVPRVENSSGDALDDYSYWLWPTNYYLLPGLEDDAWDAYDFRHISTTYNVDRIITPDGHRMFNVNRINDASYPGHDIWALWQILWNVIDSAHPTLALQMAVNMKDYIDTDSDVTEYVDISGVRYHGFERPAVYLSEIVCKMEEDLGGDPNYAFAVELYREYQAGFGDANLAGWQLDIDGKKYAIAGAEVTSEFYVVRFDSNSGVTLAGLIGSGTDESTPGNGALSVDPSTGLSWSAVPGAVSYKAYIGAAFDDVEQATDVNYVGSDPCYDPGADFKEDTWYYWRVDALDGLGNVLQSLGVWSFKTGSAGSSGSIGQAITFAVDEQAIVPGSTIKLLRPVPGGNYIVVDQIQVPNWLFAGASGEVRSFQRDNRPHRSISQRWYLNPPDQIEMDLVSLGSRNVYEDPASVVIQVQTNDKRLTNIGELGKVLHKSAYQQGTNQIGNADTPATALLDVGDPAVQRVFNYLTVFDPNDHGQPLGETRIQGRININTAPWYVIAQLPWMTPEIAQAIVAYRDVLDKPVNMRPFRNIGELMNVPGMDKYALDGVDQGGRPDLTARDGAADDFEERDLLLARISNLITVRSDVFTAYILVRIGADGPQKRMIAILDRSNVYSPSDRVRIRALQPVPDPR